VEENRAEVNFELGRATRGARRERLDLWPAPPRAGEEASRSARCADRGRPPAAATEEAPGAARRNSATVARRQPRAPLLFAQASDIPSVYPGDFPPLSFLIKPIRPLTHHEPKLFSSMTASVILTTGWSPPPLHPCHPLRWPSTPPSTTTGDTFQNHDRLLDPFSFRSQLGQHFRDVHRSIIACRGPINVYMQLWHSLTIYLNSPWTTVRIKAQTDSKSHAAV
jgi:hypothetical protein